eukprot:TRINITY_DN4229_c0_g1_i2.p1 TRINITY_DN4229_c0_g1~~TRINITY_DN4229_c0_g1_i2.p1  ORF type:complete len:1267 (-),score=345.86 TRINITY_DN4229_c0_g1_i2:121-3921(-)
MITFEDEDSNYQMDQMTESENNTSSIKSEKSVSKAFKNFVKKARPKSTYESTSAQTTQKSLKYADEEFRKNRRRSQSAEYLSEFINKPIEEQKQEKPTKEKRKTSSRSPSPKSPRGIIKAPKSPILNSKIITQSPNPAKRKLSSSSHVNIDGRQRSGSVSPMRRDDLLSSDSTSDRISSIRSTRFSHSQNNIKSATITDNPEVEENDSSGQIRRAKSHTGFSQLINKDGSSPSNPSFTSSSPPVQANSSNGKPSVSPTTSSLKSGILRTGNKSSEKKSFQTKIALTEEEEARLVERKDKPTLRRRATVYVPPDYQEKQAAILSSSSKEGLSQEEKRDLIIGLIGSYNNTTSEEGTYSSSTATTATIDSNSKNTSVNSKKDKEQQRKIYDEGAGSDEDDTDEILIKRNPASPKSRFSPQYPTKSDPEGKFNSASSNSRMESSNEINDDLFDDRNTTPDRFLGSSHHRQTSPRYDSGSKRRNSRTSSPIRIRGGSFQHLFSEKAKHERSPASSYNNQEKNSVDDVNNSLNASPQQFVSPVRQKFIEELCMASISGDLDTVKALTKSMGSLEINMNNKRGMNALNCAAREGNEEIVKYLLSFNGIGVNIQDRHGNTPIHYSSYFSYPRILSLLLSYGCDTHILNHLHSDVGCNQDTLNRGKTAEEEARGDSVFVWKLYNQTVNSVSQSTTSSSSSGLPFITPEYSNSPNIFVMSNMPNNAHAPNEKDDNEDTEEFTGDLRQAKLRRVRRAFSIHGYPVWNAREMSMNSPLGSSNSILELKNAKSTEEVFSESVNSEINHEDDDTYGEEDNTTDEDDDDDESDRYQYDKMNDTSCDVTLSSETYDVKKYPGGTRTANRRPSVQRSKSWGAATPSAINNGRKSNFLSQNEDKNIKSNGSSYHVMKKSSSDLLLPPIPQQLIDYDYEHYHISKDSMLDNKSVMNLSSSDGPKPKAKGILRVGPKEGTSSNNNPTKILLSDEEEQRLEEKKDRPKLKRRATMWIPPDYQEQQAAIESKNNINSENRLPKSPSDGDIVDLKKGNDTSPTTNLSMSHDVDDRKRIKKPPATFKSEGKAFKGNRVTSSNATSTIFQPSPVTPSSTTKESKKITKRFSEKIKKSTPMFPRDTPEFKRREDEDKFKSNKLSKPTITHTSESQSLSPPTNSKQAVSTEAIMERRVHTRERSQTIDDLHHREFTQYSSFQQTLSRAYQAKRKSAGRPISRDHHRNPANRSNDPFYLLNSNQGTIKSDSTPSTPSPRVKTLVTSTSASPPN